MALAESISNYCTKYSIGNGRGFGGGGESGIDWQVDPSRGVTSLRKWLTPVATAAAGEGRWAEVCGA